jgi:hypothetical protein
MIDTKITNTCTPKFTVLESKRDLDRVWGSHSGGYEEYHLLGYNAA